MSLLSPIICACCGKTAMRRNGDINRAKKFGRPIYCNKECSGRIRHIEISDKEKKEKKRLYDIEYREKNLDRIKENHRQYFKKTYDPEKAAIKRKENMHKHVEYCRSEKYKEYKQQYDKEYLAKKEYGEFWQCFLFLLNIENEISERVSPQEIRSQNGTLNKRQQRKREYERLNSN